MLKRYLGPGVVVATRLVVSKGFTLTHRMNLFEQNINCLGQVIELLRRMECETYQRKVSHCLDSSIGGHCRHIIDHYRQFFDAFNHPRLVNYDARLRDPELENDVGKAVAAIEGIIATLRENQMMDPGTECSVCSGQTDPPVESVPSSVGRELLFTLSHSIHHYAIIAVICRTVAIPVSNDFGVAPSTLEHRRRVEAMVGADCQ